MRLGAGLETTNFEDASIDRNLARNSTNTRSHDASARPQLPKLPKHLYTR